MLKKLAAGIAGVAIAAVGVAAIAGNLSGAGATFPAPVYQKWAEAYKGATGNQLNYQAIGSGGGIKQIEANTVDFGPDAIGGGRSGDTMPVFGLRFSRRRDGQGEQRDQRGSAEQRGTYRHVRSPPSLDHRPQSGGPASPIGGGISAAV